MVTGNALLVSFIQSASAETVRIYLPSAAEERLYSTSMLLSPSASIIYPAGMTNTAVPEPSLSSMLPELVSSGVSPPASRVNSYTYSAAFAFTMMFSLRELSATMYSRSAPLSMPL